MQTEDKISGSGLAYNNYFDEYVLVRAVQDAGFSISDINYFCYNNFPMQHRNNGKEFIGLIGVK